MFECVEAQVRAGMEWLRLMVETLDALAIALGTAIGLRHPVDPGVDFLNKEPQHESAAEESGARLPAARG